MDKPETQVFPDPFVGNLLCFFQRISVFSKTCVFESEHQAPKKRTKKDKELNKKREEIENGDQKEQQKKKRHIKYVYILII